MIIARFTCKIPSLSLSLFFFIKKKTYYNVTLFYKYNFESYLTSLSLFNLIQYI